MRPMALLPILPFLTIPSLLLPPARPSALDASSISLATDKTRYLPGDLIRLVVTNRSDSPIWYIAYPQPDLVFWALETPTDQGWRSLAFRLPLIDTGGPICRLAMYERPIGVATDLQPHSTLSYDWHQQMCVFETPADSPPPQVLQPGRYRFLFRYSLDTVTSENLDTAPWKRPVELGDLEVAYSNEFIVE